ncbi:MAG: hypothetical protein VYE26_07320 [Pseudomonadota bacterium]|jgi:hypothetical protein|nr:hypothetical protein [Pseudomonadota bacterium]
MPDTETELNSSEIAQDVQSELMDMIIADESPATISDKIKDMLFAKSADRVDNFRPDVAANTFGDEEAAAAVADAAAHISGEVAAQADAEEAPAEE